MGLAWPIFLAPPMGAAVAEPEPQAAKKYAFYSNNVIVVHSVLWYFLGIL